MTLLKIIEYPDPFLTIKAKPVENIDNETLKLIEDMAETMFHAPGVGLAATQVSSDKRIIVYNPNTKDARDGEPEEVHDDNLASSAEDNAGGDPRQNSSDSGRRKQDDYRALINPEIIAASGSLTSESEACLSVPDFSADVKRFSRVTVRALNTDGKRVQFDAEDIQAVILQHEIDHLDGILFIDRISMLKRNMYRKRMAKRAKNG